MGKHVLYLIALICIVHLFNSCRSNEQDSSLQTIDSLDASKGVAKINLKNSNQHINFEDIINKTSSWPDLSKSNESKFNSIIMDLDSLIIEGKMFYILEGDLVLDRYELEEYLTSQYEELINHSKFVKPYLIILSSGKDTIKLQKPESVKFAIVKSDFSDSEYGVLVNALKVASTDWNNTCNVKFIHEVKFDQKQLTSDDLKELFFVVKKVDSKGKYEANAPFPHFKKENMKLRIDKSFFTSIYNKAGIIRHELGHVMGFLHEHVRSGAPKTCPKGTLDPHFPLSSYDPQSVMHYYCKTQGFGTLELKITKIDSVNSLKVYPF